MLGAYSSRGSIPLEKDKFALHEYLTDEIEYLEKETDNLSQNNQCKDDHFLINIIENNKKVNNNFLIFEQQIQATGFELYKLQKKLYMKEKTRLLDLLDLFVNIKK